MGECDAITHLWTAHRILVDWWERTLACSDARCRPWRALRGGTRVIIGDGAPRPWEIDWMWPPYRTFKRPKSAFLLVTTGWGGLGTFRNLHISLLFSLAVLGDAVLKLRSLIPFRGEGLVVKPHRVDLAQNASSSSVAELKMGELCEAWGSATCWVAGLGR